LAGEGCIHSSAVHIASDAFAGLGIFDHRVLVKEAVESLKIVLVDRPKEGLRYLAALSTRYVLHLASDYVDRGSVTAGVPAAQALERSKVEAELVAMPFPTWYRQAFVEGLARVLRRARRRKKQSEPPRFSRGS
jgi:hypothetical protein